MIDEREARRETKCRGCRRDKGVGLLVCWDCFRGGEVPFKHFDGSLGEWLQVVQKV